MVERIKPIICGICANSFSDTLKYAKGDKESRVPFQSPHLDKMARWRMQFCPFHGAILNNKITDCASTDCNDVIELSIDEILLKLLNFYKNYLSIVDKNIYTELLSAACTLMYDVNSTSTSQQKGKYEICLLGRLMMRNIMNTHLKYLDNVRQNSQGIKQGAKEKYDNM